MTKKAKQGFYDGKKTIWVKKTSADKLDAMVKKDEKLTSKADAVHELLKK